MDVLQGEEISPITDLYPGTSKDQEVLLGCHFLHYHSKGYVMVVFTFLVKTILLK